MGQDSLRSRELSYLVLLYVSCSDGVCSQKSSLELLEGDLS